MASDIRRDGRLSWPRQLDGDWLGIEPTTAWSQVRCPNHYTTETRNKWKKTAPCRSNGWPFLRARQRLDEKNFRRSHLNFLPSSKSRNTKTRTDIKNPARKNLDIVLQLKNQQSFCQLPWKMADEIDFEKGRISNFQCHVTFTLTLDRVIWYTVVHHSSTSTYTPNFIQTFCGQTDGRTYVLTDIEAGFIRSSWRSRPKNKKYPSPSIHLFISGSLAHIQNTRNTEHKNTKHEKKKRKE